MNAFDEEMGPLETDTQRLETIAAMADAGLSLDEFGAFMRLTGEAA